MMLYTFVYDIYTNKSIIEGVEGSYTEYSGNDPLILSKKNAGNIEYLKGQIDDLISIKSTVIDMKNTVDKLNQQVSAISQQQQIYSQKITNSGSTTQ
jgi:hypothetical protein